MSDHEKQLLMIITFLLLASLSGLVIASLVTGESLIFLLKGIRIGWGFIIIFLLIGFVGVYLELSLISPEINLMKQSGDKWPVSNSSVFGTALGLYLVLTLFGISSFGTDKAGLLQGSYNTVIAGLGFSSIFGLMFISAVVARLIKN